MKEYSDVTGNYALMLFSDYYLERGDFVSATHIDTRLTNDVIVPGSMIIPSNPNNNPVGRVDDIMIPYCAGFYKSKYGIARILCLDKTKLKSMNKIMAQLSHLYFVKNGIALNRSRDEYMKEFSCIRMRDLQHVDVKN